MKKITRCYECRRLVRFYDTYKVRLSEPELRDGRLMEEVRLCPTCTRIAGYKVKKDEYSKQTA